MGVRESVCMCVHVCVCVVGHEQTFNYTHSLLGQKATKRWASQLDKTHDEAAARREGERRGKVRKKA